MTLPVGWDEIPLKEVLFFQEGPGVRKWQFTSEGVKLVNVKNIVDGKLNLDNTDRHLSEEETYGKYAHFLADAGDLVMASSGATWGKTAWIGEEHLPLCMNTSMIRFRPLDDKVVNRNYMRWFLDSTYFSRQIERLITGSAQPNFGPSHLKQVSMILPPLAEQKRIAAVLDKAAELRTKRQQAIAHLDTLLQSVFLDMFGDPLEEWQKVEVLDLVMEGKNKIRTGPFGSQLLHSEFIDDPNGVAVLGIDNAVQNKFVDTKSRFISQEKYEQLKRYTVFPGDILITIMGTCGRCAIVPENIPLAINTKHLCCITLDQSKCLPIFLKYAFLLHPDILRQLGVSKKGAIMDGLNMGAIKKLKLNLPPLTLQGKFEQIERKIFDQISKQESLFKNSELLFNSLQQRAFRGEL
ncbi:MAG: restriction endonuclease subunit S [Chloroflexota bacterium]